MAQFLDSLVTVYSNDIAKAASFYGGLLGLQESYRFPREGEPEHIEYRIGSTTVAISSPAGLATHGMPEPTRGHSFEIGFKVDDVDALAAELETAGVPILRPPFDSAAGNRTAILRRPGWHVDIGLPSAQEIGGCRRLTGPPTPWISQFLGNRPLTPFETKRGSGRIRPQ
jgi:lactoylglutathione lyase